MWGAGKYVYNVKGRKESMMKGRKCGRERRLASVIGDIGSQSSVVVVLVLAQAGSVNRREGGREKAAVALGVGSLGMRSSELEGVLG